jgi:hypothetical protein
VEAHRKPTEDGQAGVAWSFEPAVLQVFRSTSMQLRVDRKPSDHPQATCAWNFGDGSPVAEGCSVEHTFLGGQADQVVTLTLTEGDWSWNGTRTVPLERLEVVEGLAEEATSGSSDLPEPPSGASSFRLALIADTAAEGGPPEGVARGITALTNQIRPELVIHLGGAVAKGSGDAGWDQVRTAIGEPLAARQIPLAWAMSPTDLAEGARVKRPDLQLVDGRLYPERYSFTFKGAFFAVFAVHDKGVSEDTLGWLRGELEKARVYEARFAVSYFPLNKLTEAHLGSLDQRFRFYELFLRGRVTAHLTAGYRVYFKGRYGAMPVVSVGTLAAPGGTLSGTDFAQPASLVVIDLVKGVPERILAVEGPGFERTFDEGRLPATVEVYTH